jgi:hypothetical protein
MSLPLAAAQPPGPAELVPAPPPTIPLQVPGTLLHQQAGLTQPALPACPPSPGSHETNNLEDTHLARAHTSGRRQSQDLNSDLRASFCPVPRGLPCPAPFVCLFVFTGANIAGQLTPVTDEMLPMGLISRTLESSWGLGLAQYLPYMTATGPPVF